MVNRRRVRINAIAVLLALLAAGRVRGADAVAPGVTVVGESAMAVAAGATVVGESAMAVTAGATVVNESAMAVPVGATISGESAVAVTAGTTIADESAIITGERQASSVVEIRGRVHEIGSPDPVAGAVARVLGSTAYAETGADGRFVLKPPPGQHVVTVAAPGYRTFNRKIRLEAGKPVVLKVPLVRVELRADEVVVRGRREAAQPSQSAVTREEVKSTPGTAGDALRAVQNLPGVVMVNDMMGQIAVRGGGPYDNLYLIDGIPWPVPFHFGGLTATVNTELLKQVDLYAAAFDSRWGNSHGAVLDARTRPPAKDRLHGAVDVNMVQSEGMLETPLGIGDASLAIGGKRSYYDLIFGRMFRDTFSTFPRFWDLGGSLDVSLSAQDRIRLIGLTTDDALALLVKPDEGNTIYVGDLHMHNTYETGGATWTSTRIPKVTSRLTPYAYGVVNDMGFGSIFGMINRRRMTGIKEEASWEAGNTGGMTHVLGFGGELARVNDSLLGFFNNPDTGEMFSTTVAGRGLVHGAWLQDRVGLGGGLAVTVGGRYDKSNIVDKSSVTPRASIEWKYDPLTTFRAAWGQYDQFPNGWALNPDYGNPRLNPEYAYHAVLGAERKFGGGLFGRVEVYDKRYHRLVVGDNGEGNYANTGDGMARGVELFLKENIGERFFGWASYAWSVSKRKERSGEAWARYRYDQPHVATVVASYALTPAWRVGAKFRYNSGPLYTPVVGRYLDSYGNWQPIDGVPYSRRLADYIRFDIRIEHAFRFSRWKLNLYTDVLNVFGRSNPAGLGYSEDYSESRQYNNLPRLFYVGLAAQF